jgi:hypothetical protein
MFGEHTAPASDPQKLSRDRVAPFVVKGEPLYTPGDARIFET